MFTQTSITILARQRSLRLITSLYCDSRHSCIHIQIGAGIFAVATAGAVATSEVNCSNSIGHSRGLRTRSASGTVAQRNDP